MPRGIRKDGKPRGLIHGEKKSAEEVYKVPMKPVIQRRPKAGQPEKYTLEWVDKEADILLEWLKKDEGVYIGSFAYERGYAKQRLPEFCQKSVKFSEAMEKAKSWQEAKFLEKGLTREWDAAQVRYTMARVCGDIWKASYDREDSESKEITLNINVNKI